jgi:type IX secretion system PorP/SprF family membrane protein
MRKFIIISAGLLMIIQVVLGQNTKHYTPVNMYMMNTLLINPGYAGTKEAMSGSLMYGVNWTGMPGAGNLMAMSFDSPINWLKGRVALGGLATSSTYGLNTNTNVYGYYNYRIPIGQGKLGLGLRGGVNNYSRRLTRAEFRQANDPAQLDESRVVPEFRTGCFLVHGRLLCRIIHPGFLFPPLRLQCL